MVNKYVKSGNSDLRHKEDLQRFNQTSPELKLLFHGTDDEDTVRGICYQNFDPRMHGKHATLYGKGAYFARDASYSHNYTASTGKRYMFLADVLVGEYTKGDSNMQRPPKKHGQSSNRQYELYDSTSDNVYDPSIFVIYAMEKCYPSYLILYKEKGAQVNWKTYQEGYSHAVGSYMNSSLTGAYYKSSPYPGSLPQKTSMSTSSSSTSTSSQKSKCSIQ